MFSFLSAGQPFPDFGSPIFRKFAELPSLSREVGPLSLSLGVSTQAHIDYLRFGHKQSIGLVPGVATGFDIGKARVNLGLASTHSLATPEFSLDDVDGDFDDDEPLLKHSHSGFEVGTELSYPEYGTLAVKRLVGGGVEFLLSPKTFDVLGTQVETGFQVVCSPDKESPRTWRAPRYAVGFSSRLPLDKLGLPKPPGIEDFPTLTAKIDTDLDVEAIIEAPVLKKMSSERFQRPLNVGVLLGRRFKGPHPDNRLGVFLSYGIFSVSYGLNGLAVFGITISGDTPIDEFD